MPRTNYKYEKRIKELAKKKKKEEKLRRRNAARADKEGAPEEPEGQENGERPTPEA